LEFKFEEFYKQFYRLKDIRFTFWSKK